MVLSYLDLRHLITFWPWYCTTSIYGFFLPFGHGIVLLRFTASYYLLAMVLSYLDLRLLITFWPWYCPT
jgi:hypothetical protein